MDSPQPMEWGGDEWPQGAAPVPEQQVDGDGAVEANGDDGGWPAAVAQDWQVLARAPAEVRGNPAVICEAMRDSSGQALQYASEELRGDREFLLGAAEEMGPAVLEHSAEGLRADREFIMQVADFCSPGDVLWYTSDEVRGELLADRDFVLEAIQQVGSEVIGQAAPALRGDKTFILAAAEYCCGPGEAIQFATKELQREFYSDHAFMIQAVKDGGADALEDATEELRSSHDFMMEVADICGGIEEVATYACGGLWREDGGGAEVGTESDAAGEEVGALPSPAGSLQAAADAVATPKRGLTLAPVPAPPVVLRGLPAPAWPQQQQLQVQEMPGALGGPLPRNSMFKAPPLRPPVVPLVAPLVPMPAALGAAPVGTAFAAAGPAFAPLRVDYGSMGTGALQYSPPVGVGMMQVEDLLVPGGPLLAPLALPLAPMPAALPLVEMPPQLPAPLSEKKIGARVRRGPDWVWENQDGGDGLLGITENHSNEGWVQVRWDSSGECGVYRVGLDGACDLLEVPFEVMAMQQAGAPPLVPMAPAAQAAAAFLPIATEPQQQAGQPASGMLGLPPWRRQATSLVGDPAAAEQSPQQQLQQVYTVEDEARAAALAPIEVPAGAGAVAAIAGAACAASDPRKRSAAISAVPEEAPWRHRRRKLNNNAVGTAMTPEGAAPETPLPKAPAAAGVGTPTTPVVKAKAPAAPAANQTAPITPFKAKQPPTAPVAKAKTWPVTKAKAPLLVAKAPLSVAKASTAVKKPVLHAPVLAVAPAPGGDEVEAALALHHHIATQGAAEDEVLDVEVLDVEDEPPAATDSTAPAEADAVSAAEAALTSIQKLGAEALENVPVELRGDREFMLSASRMCQLPLLDMLRFAADELRKELYADREFMLRAVEEVGACVLVHASMALRSDLGFMMEASACSSASEAMKYASDDLKADLDSDSE